MGKTRAADWITHQDQMLDILLKFMDTIAPGERFVIVGSSYGAYLARGIVHQRLTQLDGLAITVPLVKREPAHLPEHRVIKEDAAFLKALRPDEQNLINTLTIQSMETLENIRKNFFPAFAIADYDFLEQLKKNYWFSFDVDSLSQPFPSPALILCGRFDHWCGYHDAFQLLDQYPRATFAVLDRAGHGLGSEQKSLFQTLVGEWLDRVEEYQKR
jgi:pimeloyl-ACP methyl ester carboxylesterase